MYVMKTIWYDRVMYIWCIKWKICSKLLNFTFNKQELNIVSILLIKFNIYVFLCNFVICLHYYLMKTLNQNFSNTRLLSILFSHERKRYGGFKCHYWGKTWIRNRSMVKKRSYKLKLESRLHITSAWFSKGKM